VNDREPETPPSPWLVAWRTGWLAAKQNRIPGIAMWLFGIAVLAGYFLVPAFHEWLDAIGRLKQLWGWKFSLISTAVFGGLLPSLIAMTMRANSGQVRMDLIISNTILWAYKGVEIDLFYRLQSWLFGAEADFRTIVIKTVCDQFLMVPAFGIVNVVLFFVWRDAGYSFKRFLASLGTNWYRNRVLPVLIANWFIWIPAVMLIYSLPPALQLPMQNLILCFWALVLLVFSKKATPTR
jgi:hypothetical protein